MEKIMKYLLIPIVFIAFDYFKNPIDRLYFHKPLRPLVGIRNTLLDMLLYKPFYHPNDFNDLWILKLYHREILDSVYSGMKNVKKYYFHDDDKWFDETEKYYYYKLEDFPLIKSRMDKIPCVVGGMIAVMEGPMHIPPHRAEHNLYLRYHLTLEGTSTLTTEYETHEHKAGEHMIFDHSRYHKVEKTTDDRRIVLILDIKRF
jgi:hypothetical protein